MKTYSFSAPIEKVEGIDGAFVRVPLDVPRVFGAGRIKVHATFDGAPYDGSVVAFKRDDGGRDYVLGIRKDIRCHWQRGRARAWMSRSSVRRWTGRPALR